MLDYNGAGEQRPRLIPSLHGLYVKPQSSRRLLQWHGYVNPFEIHLIVALVFFMISTQICFSARKYSFGYSLNSGNIKSRSSKHDLRILIGYIRVSQREVIR